MKKDSIVLSLVAIASVTLGVALEKKFNLSGKVTEGVKSLKSKFKKDDDKTEDQPAEEAKPEAPAEEVAEQAPANGAAEEKKPGTKK